MSHVELMKDQSIALHSWNCISRMCFIKQKYVQSTFNLTLNYNLLEPTKNEQYLSQVGLPYKFCDLNFLTYVM